MRFFRLACERALHIALTAAAGQPRVPAGSSKGGQFGKKTGGTITVSATNAPYAGAPHWPVGPSPSAGATPTVPTINPMTAPRAAIVAHLRATGFKGSVSVSVPALRQMAANHIAARAGLPPPPQMPGPTGVTPRAPQAPHTPAIPTLPRTVSPDLPGHYAGKDYATTHADIKMGLGVQGQVALIRNSGHSITDAEVTAWQSALAKAKSDLATQLAEPTQSWYVNSARQRVTLIEGQLPRAAALAVVSANADWMKMTRNQVLAMSAATGVSLSRRSGAVANVRADLRANISSQINGVKVHWQSANRVAAQAQRDAIAAKATAVSLAALKVKRDANALLHPSLSKMLDPAAVTNTDHTPAPYAHRSTAVREVAKAYQALGYDNAPVHARVTSVTALQARGDIAVVVYRGVSDGYVNGSRVTASDIVAHFGSATRDHYVGDGIYGQGTYTSPHMRTAQGYAPGGRVMVMGIRKDATVVKHSEVVAFMRTNPSLARHDKGTVAMIMGADVMRVDDGTDHYVVYNRAAVVFVQPDASGMFAP